MWSEALNHISCGTGLLAPTLHEAVGWNLLEESLADSPSGINL